MYHENMNETHGTVKQTFEETRDLFVAFGDRYRQEIILLLAENAQLTVKDLSVMLRLSRPALSHHIKLLKEAGMLAARKEGVRIYYYPTLEQPLNKLKELINQTEKIMHCVGKEHK